MKRIDVIIIGAGMAGLSLAALLGQQGIAVTVIDREDPEQMATEEFDSRTVALSAGTRAILEPLGVWEKWSGDGAAITAIDVQEGHDAFLLNFDAAKTKDGAFGWILPNNVVRGALYRAAKAHGVRFLQDSLKEIQTTENSVQIILQSGEEVAAQLLIGADGRNSRVRALLGIDTVNLDYKQTAHVGLVEHEKPHNGLAVERFYPDGPFAILPFTDGPQGHHRSAIVWTRHSKRKISVPSIDQITQDIAPFFDVRYGAIKAVGRWAAFPLTLHHAKSFIADRVALISDAAHAIHPIAGQGLNLGMRDVAKLAELLTAAKGTDLGAAELLEQYQRARRVDVLAMVAATDILNRLFGNNLFFLRALRSAGLGLVNKIPPLKKFFMNVAMGQR